MKKRITQKRLREFISKVAEKKPSKLLNDDAMSYYSKIDGSYFTREGMEMKEFKFLLKYGITEQLQNVNNVSSHSVNIGFNPEENKWYGWSHRALYGFGVGSVVKKGDCGYVPADINDAREAALRFWASEYHENLEATYERDGNGKAYFKVSWDYMDSVPNKKLHGAKGGTRHYLPECFGRGEWTAKTLGDAKQMAMDFAEGVS